MPSEKLSGTLPRAATLSGNFFSALLKTKNNQENGETEGGLRTSETKTIPRAHITDGLKFGDVVYKFGLPTDIVIPIMGATGAGKSTFINTLAQQDCAKVGHGLQSCTNTLQHIVIDDVPARFHCLRGRRIILVDTPGFNDTSGNDTEILRKIAVWLAYSYATDVEVAGVIFLHDISNPRLAPGAKLSCEIFTELCGQNAFRSISLVTTKWTTCYKEQMSKREAALRSTLWKSMIDSGASVHRFGKSYESAWDIVNAVIHKNELHPRTLQIQTELVDLSRRIPETAASRALRESIKRYLAKLEKISQQSEDAQAANAAQLTSYRAQLSILKVDTCRRLMLKAGLA